MNEVQAKGSSKRQYVRPVMSMIEIGNTALLAGSGSLKIIPDGHGDADKAMIGVYSSPWDNMTEEEDEDI